MWLKKCWLTCAFPNLKAENVSDILWGQPSTRYQAVITVAKRAVNLAGSTVKPPPKVWKESTTGRYVNSKDYDLRICTWKFPEHYISTKLVYPF